MSAVSSCALVVVVAGLLSVTLPATPASATLPASEPDNTGMVNGNVRSIVQAGGRIWVSGTFTQMLDANGNVARTVNNLAAFNASTGAPDLAVSIPSVTKSAGVTVVYDMSVAPDGKVYIAGAFDRVNDQPRKNVASFDPNTGALGSFSANPANATAVLATSDAVFVGTSKLVKFTLSGADAPGYGPPEVAVIESIRGHTIPAQFRDIVQVGSTLVAACQCDTLNDGGANENVKAVVKIDANTGDRLNWAPAGLTAQSAAFGISAFVRDFPSASDRTVYLGAGGSDFTAAYDYESGNQRWKTDTSGSSQVVAWHQNTVIVGGHFQWVPKTANQQCDDNKNPNLQCWHAPRLVAMDPSDGDVILQNGAPWNPGICCKYNGVWALLVDQDGGKLHVGGEFTKAGGTWSGAGINWNVIGAQNQDFYARFFGPATGSQTLTVSKAGAGTGTVTSSPAGINCGTTCSASYAIGATVTLTASPAAGSTFTGWSGDCSGAGSTCTVTLSSSRNVVATFEPVSHVLTVNKAGLGLGAVTSQPAGISCGNTCTTPATASFPGGTVAALTATPGSTSVFTGWSGGGCSGTATCQVTMNAATTVTASFQPSRQLAVTKTGTGTGTVTSSPVATINCGTTCSGGFAQGSNVTLTAAAEPGSVFTGWSGGGCTVAAPTCAVSMNTGQNVNASFELLRTLSVGRTGMGTGTITSNVGGINCGTTCSAQYANGAVVTLTAAPAGSSTFTGWTGACSGTGSCVVTMDAAKSAFASFELVSHPVSVQASGLGGGSITSSPAGISCSPTCSGSFVQGSTVTLTATPDANSTFESWNGVCSLQGPTCSFTVESSTTVAATFDEIVHELTVATTGQGTGTVTSDVGSIDCPGVCSDTYAQPTVVTLTASADPGAAFAGWAGGGCTGTAPCAVTMDQARSVTARFTVPLGLDVTLAGSGTGRVTSDTGSIDCPGVCSDTYASDSVVTLTADPDPDMAFTGWSGAGCSGTGTCTVTVDGATSVTATFQPASGCGRILFVSTRSGNPDVWVMDANGANETNLTNRSGSDTDPMWSPDCSKIVFTSTRGGNVDIYVMNANGSGAQRLTTDAASDTEPTWSSDGTKIAFVSTRTGNAEIFVMNANGTSQVNETNNAAVDTSPDWSPDGTKIVFDSTRGGGLNVWTMTPTGGSPTKITTGLGKAQAPAWSPNGTKIALVSNSGGRNQIWAINANGSGAVRITNDAGVHSHPSWSPDGAKVAYANTLGGVSQIWVVNQNGSDPVNTSTSTKADRLPNWTA